MKTKLKFSLYHSGPMLL